MKPANSCPITESLSGVENVARFSTSSSLIVRMERRRRRSCLEPGNRLGALPEIGARRHSLSPAHPVGAWS